VLVIGNSAEEVRAPKPNVSKEHLHRNPVTVFGLKAALRDCKISTAIPSRKLKRFCLSLSQLLVLALQTPNTSAASASNAPNREQSPLAMACVVVRSLPSDELLRDLD